jgi:hypothetical protein
MVVCSGRSSQWVVGQYSACVQMAFLIKVLAA